MMVARPQAGIVLSYTTPPAHGCDISLNSASTAELFHQGHVIKRLALLSSDNIKVLSLLLCPEGGTQWLLERRVFRFHETKLKARSSWYKS